MGIQINGNTNNINAGIGSLSIEDLNELDIVGVATAANFKTGTSNVHSTGYECTNVNATGVITATSFVGSGANLTSLPTQVTISNNSDNRIITGGSGTNLNGESTLNYGSGHQLTFSGSATPLSGTGHNYSVNIYRDGGSGYGYFDTITSGSYTTGVKIRTYNNTTYNNVIEHTTSKVTNFQTNGLTRLSIDSSGRMILGATGTIGNTYSDNFTVSEASGNVGMQFAGNNSTSNYASIYFGDAGHRQKHFIETQLGTNGHFTLGTIGTGPIRFTNSGGERLRIAGTGKIGINNNNPTHPLHIVNTSSTFNSASLIRGDTSTSGGGAYVTFTNTADSKSAYFGVDGNGLFNLDAGAALVGTNGDEPIIFATNGNNTKVRIFGGTDNCLQLDGGSKLSITDYAPNLTFSGTYAGLHHDNHGNTLLALNAHLNYSGTSGTHQWKQSNGHPTIGSAGMFIGGNGSANNSNITFFRNGQGSSAGTVFDQDSWKFQIGSALRQNFNLMYLQRGYQKTDTSNQNASNFPLAASGIGGYAFGYQEAFSTSNGSWAHPYPDLVLGYHTGMRFGANRSYGGCRFYDDHPYGTNTIYMSIGNSSTGVHVVNSLSKGGGSFRIAHPHPSKKYTHDLVHSFIEGPQMDLIYRGKVDLVGGSATVNIDTASNMTDGTFVLLNRDVQCFTSNETGWTAVKGSVSGNVLTITAQDNSCTDTISWMVIGERQDDKIKSLDMTDDNGDLIVEPLTIEETHM